MRPGGAGGHEALQVQRRGHRAGHARTGVGQVGNVAGQVAQVRAPQRHPPHRVTGELAGGQPLRGQRLVVGEQRRQVRPQCDPRRAGEGGEVQDQRRLAFAGIGQRVAQHHPAFGVGVVDLHADPGAGGDHFARPIRLRADRVLHRRHQQGQPHRQTLRHHQPGQGQCVRGAAHVLLHVAHAVGWFDVQAAGVETHALADDHHVRMRGVAPVQFDQPRGAVRGAAHGVDGGEVARQQIIAGHHLDLGAVRGGQVTGGGFQVLRTHVLAGRVDPVAHPRAGLQQVQGLGIELRQLQLRRCAWRGLVALEAVAAQAPAQLQRGQCFAGQLPGRHPGARRQGQGCVRIAARIQAVADATHRPGDARRTRQQGHGARRGHERLRIQPRRYRLRLHGAPGGIAFAIEQVQGQCGRIGAGVGAVAIHAGCPWRDAA